MNSFSDFIRNATPEEKADVYGRVLQRATERQEKVMTQVTHSFPTPRTDALAYRLETNPHEPSSHGIAQLIRHAQALERRDPEYAAFGKDRLMTTYTPGPWAVLNHGWSETSILAGGKLLALLSIEDVATEDTQSQCEAQMAADACLMAAAPDLLAVLDEINMMACYASEEDIDSREAMLLKIGEAARAAIAKATPERRS